MNMSKRGLALGLLRSLSRLSATFQSSRRHMYGRRARFPKAPHQNQYAGYDKRHAQPLSHIENHTGLKVRLVLLNELNQESHAEKHYQEYSEDSTRTQFIQLGSIEPQQHHSQNTVAQGLVKLSGMMRKRLTVTDEDKAPRQI